MAKALRLAPEYECWPIWDDETGEDIDPANLGLPELLLRQIIAWDDAFQNTFDPDDPASSGFEDSRAARAWHQEGIRLAMAMEASGKYSVTVLFPTV